MDDKQTQHKDKYSEPLTLQKINQEIKDRIENITEEFKNGFNFIKTVEKSVTFFGSARTKESENDYQTAMKLAGRITKELGYTIFSGGGPGIMEAANRGALENNGKTYGLTINLPAEQTTNKFLTNHMDFKYFFSRKVCLSYCAEAYVYFPGGFGTFDELFEILTLVQTNKIEKVPVILVNSTFWNNFDSFIKENLLKEGKIDDVDTSLYTITDDLDEIIKIIKESPVR